MASNRKVINNPEIGRIQVTRSPKNRHIRMRVLGYKSLALSAPSRVPLRRLDRFLIDNLAWIKSQNTWRNPLFFEGMSIDRDRKLQIIRGIIWHFEKQRGRYRVVIPSSLEPQSVEVQQYIYDRIIWDFRTSSKEVLPQLVDKMSKIYDYRYSGTSIKNLTSRWGSYSSRGNVNLSVQLMRLHENLVTHVVLHELVHSKHMSHSHQFWSEFKKIRQNCVDERKELHKHKLWRRPC